MPIAKITGQGLAAIACSVCLLWGCVIAEQVARRNAVTERILVMREVQRLQHRPQPLPVSTPSPFAPHHPHVTAG
jgi:hypothetical protein